VFSFLILKRLQHINNSLNNNKNIILKERLKMWFYNKKYVPVSRKLSMAKKYAKKKHGKNTNPVKPESNKITTTFWGNAWCKNLNNYAKLANRLQRGQTYVCNGSVAHLEIKQNEVVSIVAGSEPYEINIKFDALAPKLWKNIKKKCAGQIASAVELLQGKLSKNILAIITDKKDGLFPTPKEIHFGCSCPDGYHGSWMCKHTAATLYAIGTLLDKQPELFFKLRCVDHLELIDTSVSLATETKDADTLDDSALSEIFDIELSDSFDTKTKKTKKNIKKIAKKTTKKKIVKKIVIKKTVKKTAVKKNTKKVTKKK
jgi:uncharacterized Zn finger protein